MKVTAECRDGKWRAFSPQANRYNLSNMVFNLELYISSANKEVSAKRGPYTVQQPFKMTHLK